MSNDDSGVQASPITRSMPASNGISDSRLSGCIRRKSISISSNNGDGADSVCQSPTKVGVESVTTSRRRTIQDLTVPDASDIRFSVLSYCQVVRLAKLLTEPISIHGRGKQTTVIEVRLSDLIAAVKARLNSTGIEFRSPNSSYRTRVRHRTSPEAAKHTAVHRSVDNVRQVRLNGSGASSVLAADFEESDDCGGRQITYNDVDLIFGVDLSHYNSFELVKQAVLDTLIEFAPSSMAAEQKTVRNMTEAYVSKMVKVNDTDRWSLIALGHGHGKSIELKFVDKMRRQYEFSVDSFHIALDNMLVFCNNDDHPNDDSKSCTQLKCLSESFYPTVIGQSMFGDFCQALDHLKHKLIATKSPEEIRGGGLLKYCNLLVQGYTPHTPAKIKCMERYMCSRFFIDFPGIDKQRMKLETYLRNHFLNFKDADVKCRYLNILYRVVQESTICLMEIERQASLNLIMEMAREHSTIEGSSYLPSVDIRRLRGHPYAEKTTESSATSAALAAAAAAAAVTPLTRMSYSNVARKLPFNHISSSVSPSPPQSSAGSMSSVCDPSGEATMSGDDRLDDMSSSDSDTVASASSRIYPPPSTAAVQCRPVSVASGVTSVPTYEFVSQSLPSMVLYRPLTSVQGSYYTPYNIGERLSAGQQNGHCYRSATVANNQPAMMCQPLEGPPTTVLHHLRSPPSHNSAQLIYVPVIPSTAQYVHSPCRSVAGDNKSPYWLVALPVATNLPPTSSKVTTNQAGITASPG